MIRILRIVVRLLMAMLPIAFSLQLPSGCWAGYSFTNIAATATSAPTGTFSGFDMEPSISDGAVEFRGTYSGGSGIFTGSGGPPTTIAKTGDAAPEHRLLLRTGERPQRRGSRDS